MTGICAPIGVHRVHHEAAARADRGPWLIAVGSAGLTTRSHCRGGQLVTLQDAGTYITKLPKAEPEAQEWQAAMEALILVATRGGPTMFARIGIMRALNRH